MQRQNWATTAGIAIFALLAIGCAFYLLAIKTFSALVVAGALLVLAWGQLLALLAQWRRNATIAGRIMEHDRSYNFQAQQSAATTDRLEIIERRLAQSSTEVLQEMRSLRDSVQNMARSVTGDLTKSNESLLREGLAPQTKTPAPAQEHLNLMLEPVIELSTGTTLHYRALINMVNGQGAEVFHDDLMSKADAGGMRAALDAHLLKLALPVLRRLRNKHPNMRLLVPLGVATLQTESDVARLIAELEQASDSADGIVVDIAHGDLASLDARGINGLAKLGRLGVTMALSNVSVAGLDLASLRRLGVRFLGINAAEFDAGTGVSPAWTEFIQLARAMQFQMIGGGITSSAQATAATRLARLGYGSYFAPPRRVRREAGHTAGMHRTQAA